MEEALGQLGPDLVNQILTAATIDRDTMRRVVDDIPPASEPVTDYITDLDERCQLFHELEENFGDRLGFLTATVFAFVLVAPISEVRLFLSTLLTNPDMLIVANATAHFAMRDCMYTLLFYSA